MSRELIDDHFQKHLDALARTKDILGESILLCCELISEALENGNKILVMGNGGSAADAQHLAAEFVGRFMLERRALPAIALTTDTSILTAVGNDYGFDQIFSRQVEALASQGDVVFGISTSGHSPNVLNALTVAREKGCRTVGLLGKGGGAIGSFVDVNLTVPSQETPRIQEAHLTIIHVICDLVEKRLAKTNVPGKN